MAFKFNITSMLGGLAGGFASSYVEDFLGKENSSEKSYTPIIVEAVAGSAISAFVKQDLIKGVGNGMVGVAGYNLAKMVSDSSSSDSPSQSGIGRLRRHRIGELLPSQSAVGQTATASNVG